MSSCRIRKATVDDTGRAESDAKNGMRFQRGSGGGGGGVEGDGDDEDEDEDEEEEYGLEGRVARGATRRRRMLRRRGDDVDQGEAIVWVGSKQASK